MATVVVQSTTAAAPASATTGDDRTTRDTEVEAAAEGRLKEDCDASTPSATGSEGDPSNEEELIGDPSGLVTSAMIAEQRALEAEEREREEREAAEIREKLRREGVRSSALSKLDVLLEKTSIFADSLLQQMEDITLPPVTPTPAPVSSSQAHEEEKGAGGGGKKRAAAAGAGKGRGRKKAKKAVEETLEQKICAAPDTHKQEVEGQEEGAKVSSSKGEEEEEDDEATRLQEQMRIAPNLTGCVLKSYQLKGVKWLISLWQNGLNGILADQMGLGKTVQTIALLAHLISHGIHGPFLVVAPLSTLSNWIAEIQRFVPSVRTVLYHGPRDVRKEISERQMPKQVTEGFPIIVTSFEVAMFDRRQLARYHWKYLVVDEGHRLKNMHCRLIRELRQLPTDNCLLLSGTPLQNNLQELWSLLNFLLPSIFSDLSEFTSWFDLDGRQQPGDETQEVFEGQRRAQVVGKLHHILRPFLLRRIKADVEKSLPKKKEIILYADMSSQQKEFQEHLIERTLEDFLNETVAVSINRTRLNNVCMQLRKNCNHPDLLTSHFDGSYLYPPVEDLIAQCGKLQLFDRLMRKLKERGHKVLIFSQMTQLLNILDYYLEERFGAAFRLDGSVKLEERRRQIHEFNNDPKAFAFLLSTRAGGLGINLTAADTVIIYDSDWNPHQDMQAMDRCHRIGQTKPVHVYRLVTAHSVECRMMEVAGRKLHLERVVIEKGQFGDKGGKTSSKVEEADVLALLRPQHSPHEELIQSRVISEENMELMLDRSDLLAPAPPSHSPSVGKGGSSKGEVVNEGSEMGRESKQSLLPASGPGWEVVQAGAQAEMLASIG